jgi:hypothetical protein
MHGLLRTLAIALAAAALAAACSQPPPKPAPPPVEEPPRNGVVGLVNEIKYREPAGNEVVGTLNEILGAKKEPTTSQWEVTVFYDDGTTGTVKLPTRPAVRPGQKVRVTGDRIEPR